MEFNTDLIKNGDCCYVPKNKLINFYGYAIINNITKDKMEVEEENGVRYYHLTPYQSKDIGINFLDKVRWMKWGLDITREYIEYH